MKDKISNQGFHLAGVVPVSGLDTDYEFPWHSSLQPLAPNYLAIERAIYECAMVGCETIWVVCNDDFAPLVKSRLGDYVESPYSLEKASYVKYPADHRESIPIFYVPIHPKDRDRRDSYIWGAFHGALTSFLVSSQMSKWLMPNKYYVSFPYGVYDVSPLKKYRSVISSDSTVLISHEKQTVKDGKYLAFTMSPSEYKQYVWDIKFKCSGGSRELSKDKRWSSRGIGLADAFDSLNPKKAFIIEVEKYHQIDSWAGYVQYLSSGHLLKKPSKKIIKPYKFNGLFYEN